MTSTLVSEVVVDRPVHHVRLTDVPLVVTELMGHGYREIRIEVPTLTIALTLTGAERIALIEALGGHDAHP